MFRLRGSQTYAPGTGPAAGPLLPECLQSRVRAWLRRSWARNLGAGPRATWTRDRAAGGV